MEEEEVGGISSSGSINNDDNNNNNNNQFLGKRARKKSINSQRSSAASTMTVSTTSSSRSSASLGDSSSRSSSRSSSSSSNSSNGNQFRYGKHSQQRLTSAYLHDMKGTIMQHLATTPVEKEQDLVAFVEWVSLFVGKTLTSHITGLMKPPLAQAGENNSTRSSGKHPLHPPQAPSSSPHGYRRVRSKTTEGSSSDEAGTDEERTSALSSPSSHSMTSTEGSAGVVMHVGSEHEEEKTGTAGVTDHVPAAAVPGSETALTSAVAPNATNSSDMELISILLDFSNKAKETAEKQQGPAHPSSPPSPSLSSSSSSSSSSHTKKTTDDIKKKTKASIVPTATHHSSVVLDTIDHKPVAIHNIAACQENQRADSTPAHPAPALSGNPGMHRSQATFANPVQPSLVTAGALLTRCLSSGDLLPSNSDASSSAVSGASPRAAPTYTYFMQSGCPHPDGVRAGNWTYYHGAGENGAPPRNVFMGQLLHAPGMPMDVQVFIAGVVRSNMDPSKNAALILDMREGAFVLMPLAPLGSLMTREFLKADALERVYQSAIWQWIRCPARETEVWSPLASPSPCYPPPHQQANKKDAVALHAQPIQLPAFAGHDMPPPPPPSFYPLTTAAHPHSYQHHHY